MKNLPFVARGLAACWLVLCAASLAHAQPAPNGSGTVVVDGVTIDGPAPPEVPGVVTRDGQGRVTIRAIKLTQSIEVDGRLSESIYESVPAVAGFIQQEPREGQPGTENTEAWILFDERNVYVAVRAVDSQPDRMVANERRRDNANIVQNDSLAIVLDTFYDRRNAFLFQTNPLGALRDGLITDERTLNTDWNTVWDVQAVRSEQGWTMEMVIPFKSLRYRDGVAQVWGINIERGIRSKNEQQYVSAIPASYGANGIFKLSSAATLVGLEAPLNTLNLEVKPYAIAGLVSDHIAEPAISNDLDMDAGFDVKYGLTRGLTADFTVNTDFAQVEADDQQVNLTRLNLFFPEKRDFFLENQGIFAFGGAGVIESSGLTPILFFSRNIGLAEGRDTPIRAGGRVTGRVGDYTLGLLDIQTGDSDITGAESTNFSVVRVRRDFLRRSTVGFMATNRAPTLESGGSGQTYGFDATMRFYDNIAIDGYYAWTQTPGLSGAEDSYRGQFDYTGDRYGFRYEHLRVGENFNPEIGFLARSAFQRNFAYARFSPRPENSTVVRKVSYEGSFDHIADPGGRQESREIEALVIVDFQSSDNLTLEYNNFYEFFKEPFEVGEDVFIDPGSYEFQDLTLIYRLGPQRRFSGRGQFGYATFYTGNKKEALFTGRIDVSPSFVLEPRYAFNWVNLPEGDFTTKLLSLRSTLTMTARMFVGVFVQYNSSNDTFASNVRFRWEYQPGSEFFIVFNEGRDTFGQGFPLLENRSVVLKFTRLFRF